MNIEDFRSFCLSKKGVTESIPFSKLPNVLVFKISGKMFTGTDLSTFKSFSIKCIPETIDELRATFSALAVPSYFNKKHWCKVVLNGSVSDKQLNTWLDISYDLVVENLPKKVKEELKAE